MINPQSNPAKAFSLTKNSAIQKGHFYDACLCSFSLPRDISAEEEERIISSCVARQVEVARQWHACTLVTELNPNPHGPLCL